MKTEVYCSRAGWSDEIEFRLITRSPASNLAWKPAPLVMSALPEGEYLEPLFRMRPDDAQALIDGLWHCGLRPTQAKASEGAQAAIEQHLKDMREISRAALAKAGLVARL